MQHLDAIRIPIAGVLRTCGGFTIGTTKIISRFEEGEGRIRLFNPALPVAKVGEKPIALAESGRGITMKPSIEIHITPGCAEILEPPVSVDHETNEVIYDFPEVVCRKTLMLGLIPGTTDPMVTILFRQYAKDYFKCGKEIIGSFTAYDEAVERLEKELADRYG